jgi:integrase
MAAIKYTVKSKEKGRLATLYLRFVDGREIDLVTSSLKKVYPEYWSNKTSSFKQRIIFDEVFTEAEKVEIENNLHDLKNFILRQYNQLSGMKPTKDWLKDVVYKFHNNSLPKEENLNQFIARFISEAEAGERLYNHNNKTKRYEHGTIKAFKGFQSQFDEYQKKKNKKLNFSDINIDFYESFVKFFIKKDYSTNTIGRHIKHLKTLMRIARDEGLHTNMEIERKKFKSLKVDVPNVYLTQKELESIEKLKLSGFEAIARDVFLIGCYTAQRFSDYSKITKDNIRKVGSTNVIDLIQQKTGERVVIPIMPKLEAILKKYSYQLPKVWEQKVNAKIKVICETAGIDEPIHVEEIKGGMKINTVKYKFDMVKTHTARRTGCTLMYKAGISTIDIMKISGHRSEREFLNYIKVGLEETAESLSRHEYFSGTKLKVV